MKRIVKINGKFIKVRTIPVSLLNKLNDVLSEMFNDHHKLSPGVPLDIAVKVMKAISKRHKEKIMLDCKAEHVSVHYEEEKNKKERKEDGNKH